MRPGQIWGVLFQGQSGAQKAEPARRCTLTISCPAPPRREMNFPAEAGKIG